MKIRGAPLIGAAAAFALALTAYHSKAKEKNELVKEVEAAAETLKATRPTAVNLFWAVNRILNKIQSFSGSSEELKSLIVEEAKMIADEDAAANRLMGKYGAKLINDGDTILTHCNAGALATVD